MEHLQVWWGNTHIARGYLSLQRISPCHLFLKTACRSPIPFQRGWKAFAPGCTKTHVTIQVACRLKSAACPLCQHSSERIHGSYGRSVADVPCGGRRVTLALTVRKFVCGIPECPRKIFTERLPALVEPYARMTTRLSEVLQTLGFATCGELGERFAPQLGMQVSGPTLLRRMRMRCCPAPSSVRILGIDDWSWKKGVTYGTILVDLELRKPIELLPDRSAETAEAWLRTHPEVELVSRDRGGDYAAAAKKGAP